MNVRPLLLIGLLCTTTAFAQGTFLYTWHGNSGYFQASFQIPADENQPGQWFEDGTFQSTFAVISPDDSYPAAGGSFSGADASGFGPPLKLSVTMTDPASGREVRVFGYSGFYAVGEYLMSNPSAELWWESGSWSSAPVPEPSALSLVGLAAIAWFARAGFSPGPRRRTNP